MGGTIVVYYSYTGNTRKRAKELAEAREAELYEIKYEKPPGTVQAYLAGSVAAMRRRPAKTEPITVDLTAYDTIILMAPVWAGYPAPPANNLLDMLPSGKNVEVWLVSGGGSSRARVRLGTKIKRQGCQMTRYVDVGPQFNLDYDDY